MELIVIDENKLKIMLTEPDMQHYDLHDRGNGHADADTRRAFRHIFEDAREQIGFDTSGERLLVQLYSSRGGGCEIFVTKLGDELPEELASIFAEKPSRLMDESAEKEEVHMCIAYRFDELSALLAVCRRTQVHHASEPFHSEVYIEERPGGDVWYLFMDASHALPYLSEYGREMEDVTALRLYLSEHGRTICADRAVETMGCL